MRNIKAVPFFWVLTIAGLLGAYAWHNTSKFTSSQKRVGAILGSNAGSQLVIQQGDTSFSFSLPTSDLFDSEGLRQLNFKYLSADDFAKIKKALPNARFLFNGRLVDRRATAVYDQALQIVLPGKKLFLVAPPHLPTAMQLLQAERRQQKDVFFCLGPALFCQETKLTDFGGLGKISGPRLKEDAYSSKIVSKRGRPLGKKMQFEFFSNTQKTVFLKFELMLMSNPQQKTRVAILAPGAQYNLKQRNGDGLLKPATLMVKMPLDSGENVLKLAFSNVLKAGMAYPYDITGVLNKVSYAPSMSYFK